MPSVRTNFLSPNGRLIICSLRKQIPRTNIVKIKIRKFEKTELKKILIRKAYCDQSERKVMVKGGIEY